MMDSKRYVKRGIYFINKYINTHGAIRADLESIDSILDYAEGHQCPFTVCAVLSAGMFNEDGYFVIPTKEKAEEKYEKAKSLYLEKNAVKIEKRTYVMAYFYDDDGEDGC